MPEGICSVDGCHHGVKAKGLCSKHHQRWYRAKVNPPTRKKPAPCVIEGCRLLTSGHEKYCKNHKRKFILYGDPLGGRKATLFCSVEGCYNRHRARGLCGSHYNIARNLESTTLNYVIRKLDEHIQDAEEHAHLHRRDAFNEFKQYLKSVANVAEVVGVSSG